MLKFLSILPTIMVASSAVVGTSDYSWEGTYAKEERQRIIQTAISSLSILGSLTIIVTYFLFKELRTSTRKFLVFISIGDFFTVYPYLVIAWVGRESGSMNCKFQSMVTTTAVMWSFFWTSCLAIYLYLVIGRKQQEKADKLMPYFHVVSWGLPLVVTSTAWGFGMLGRDESRSSGGWCWIKVHDVDHDVSHGVSIVWMLAAGKFWEIISYFIDIILCLIVRRIISREISSINHVGSPGSTQIATRAMRKLILAPLLFVLLRIWGTTRFLMFCINPHPKNESTISKILVVCHIIGDSAQGFVYFMLYCLFTPKFREVVGKALRYQGSRTKQGRPRRTEQRKYLLPNPKSIVFYT